MRLTLNFLTLAIALTLCKACSPPPGTWKGERLSNVINASLPCRHTHAICSDSNSCGMLITTPINPPCLPGYPDGTCTDYSNYCNTAPILNAVCRGNTSPSRHFDRYNVNFNTSFCVDALANSNGIIICNAHHSWVPGQYDP